MKNLFTVKIERKGFYEGKTGGPYRDRTDDLLHAMQALSQTELWAHDLYLPSENSLLSPVLPPKSTMQCPTAIVNPIQSYTNLIRVIRGKLGEIPLPVLNLFLPISSDEFLESKALLKPSQSLCGESEWTPGMMAVPPSVGLCVQRLSDGAFVKANALAGIKPGPHFIRKYCTQSLEIAARPARLGNGFGVDRLNRVVRVHTGHHSIKSKTRVAISEPKFEACHGVGTRLS